MNYIYRTYNTGTACIVYCMRANTSEAALDMLQGWVGEYVLLALEYVLLALSQSSHMKNTHIYMIIIPRDSYSFDTAVFLCFSGYRLQGLRDSHGEAALGTLQGWV